MGSGGGLHDLVPYGCIMQVVPAICGPNQARFIALSHVQPHYRRADCHNPSSESRFDSFMKLAAIAILLGQQ